jgi:tRNA(Ile)-lysidine synthetase-like protein
MPATFTNRIARALALAGVSREERLLVAFSAGRDSVSLVEALLDGGFQKLTLLHLDHALRPESAQESLWVKNFAQARQLNAVVERICVADLARAQRRGVEETARDARYAFFADAAKKSAISKIALAHHADDQIETLIFRLLRGAGMGGLSAMASKTERHSGDLTLTLLRPMLEIWRSEIDAFLHERGTPFLEDPSNTSPDFTRNRIRHTLLPEMEEVMRRPVKQALWRTAEILRAEADFLAEAERALGVIPEQLEAATLKLLPTALRRRRVARWLAHHRVPDISFELVEAVCELALRMEPSKVNLPKGAHARRKAGRIFYQAPSFASRESP